MDIQYSRSVPERGGILERSDSMKLTRKQIREGLEQVPMEVVLLGAASHGQKALSPKDIEFSRQLAMGESKAGAYRKSRPGSKAKPVTQSRRGQDLAKRGAVAAQVEAFKGAIEAQKYATPAHLRALVITELTKAAINEDFPPATRVNALKLLGTITEVAAFTERREVRQVSDSAAIKEKLLASLRLAVQSSAVDVSANDADSLLAELEPVRHDEGDAGATDNIDGGTGAREGAGAGVREGHHPNLSDDTATPMHSIPDIRLPEKCATHPHPKMDPLENEVGSGEPPLVEIATMETK